MQTKESGDARITIFNLGELRADLVSWLGVEIWPSRYDGLFQQPIRSPVQCILVQMRDMVLLVDAYYYDIAPDSSFAIANYEPPPGLVEQMAQIGVAPEAVTHVVITHLHFDHYTGVTKEQAGHFVPTFPKAQVYIGRSDWQLAEPQFSRLNSRESQTLAVLQQHGLQVLVDGEHELAHGVTIVPAPGESPGHQVVRVETAEHTLYCLGDLYHHEVEVEQPDWIVRWADAAEMAASRQALLPKLLAEDALLVAAHIEGFGRLQPTAGALSWYTIT
jgi:glyoxylase-like metal-dependent hydrolase (beta-lactamase superfamily II)